MTIATALDLSAPRSAPSGQGAAARSATPAERRCFAVDYGSALPAAASDERPGQSLPRDTGPRGTASAAQAGANDGIEAGAGQDATRAEPPVTPEDEATSTDMPETQDRAQLADPLHALLAPPPAAQDAVALAGSAPDADSAGAVPAEGTAPTQLPLPLDAPTEARMSTEGPTSAVESGAGQMTDAEAAAQAKPGTTVAAAASPGVSPPGASAAAQAAGGEGLQPGKAAGPAAVADKTATATTAATAAAAGAKPVGRPGPDTSADKGDDAGGTPPPPERPLRAAEDSSPLVPDSEAPGATGEVPASTPRRGAEEMRRITTATPGQTPGEALDELQGAPRLSIEGPGSPAAVLDARLAAEAANALDRATQVTAPTGAAPQAQAQPASAVPPSASSLAQGQPPLLSLAADDWPREMATLLNELGTLRRLGLGEALEIRLDPEALGHVTIRLEMREGAAHVAIVTQTPEAARLFTDNQQRLAEALARAGLDLGSHSAGTGDGRGSGGETGGGGPRQTADPRGGAPSAAAAPDAPSGATATTRRIDIIA